ncbi:MAG: S8 family peptidase, partial [bacterium]|nr:S8 family peptidase [bacterium]
MNEPTRRPLLVGGEQLSLDVDQVNSGGGDKYHPLTALEAADLLSPMVVQLSSEFEALPEQVRGTVLYFQTTLLPNYLAASHFPSQLLSSAGLVPVGSRSADSVLTTSNSSTPTKTKSLIVAGPPDSAERLAALIESGGSGIKTEKNAFEQLREISEVRVSSTEEILGATPRDSELWEAVLHPLGVDQAGDYIAADSTTFEKWVSWIGGLGGEVVSEYRRNEAGLTFVPVRLGPEGLEEAARFNPLRSLRPMPVIRPIPAGVFRGSAPSVLPPVHPDPEGEHTIAVFDGGVQDDAFLDDVAVADLTTEPEDIAATSHGTAVTGAAVYGVVVPGQAIARPASKAHHFRVFPGPPDPSTVYTYWILDQIESTLTKSHYPIVNLSLGPDECVEESSEPNRWTITLDRLAYEHDILFVVAAGNNGEEDAPTGLNRVQSPADMANGMSVGACDEAAAPGWERAPYSAIGPGRDGSRIQPNGVQFGGDLAAGKPFHGLHGDRQLWATHGTSFAGPLAVNSLSRLAAMLGDEWQSANTLRAFATHFAERHPSEDVRTETGHGRFVLDYERALECNPDEVHLLYQGSLERNDLLSFALPVPNTVVSGRVQLRITLAFASPVEPTQPLEYTQATIEPAFRPHSDKYRFYNKETKKTRIVDVRTDADEATKLISDGYTISGHPVTKNIPGSSGNEVQLREGGKWETVRRVDLSMNASSLLNPRLDLSYVARKAGLLQATAVPLD